MTTFFQRLRLKWRQYRYRFVPWLVFNLKKRSARRVQKDTQDKILSDEAVNGFLVDFFSHLTCNGNKPLHDYISLEDAYKILAESDLKKQHQHNLQIMSDRLGFTTERRPSTLLHGGTGVIVTSGTIHPRTIVSLYPGTIYSPHEAIFFQSINNSFIFRCIDGVLIDGKNKGLSKSIFKSCCQRERHGPFFTCDPSWLTDYPKNPLSIGQYVNNHTKEFPPNVAYQEFDVPVDFPFHLKQFLPNVFYSSYMTEMDHLDKQRLRRIVVLISLREINVGEELLSSYFTVVH